MDASPAQTTPVTTNQEKDDDDDEWDNDGFVIPSLEIEDPYQNETEFPKLDDPQHNALKTIKEESIYLGPHGAPPSQAKQQDQNLSNRKQKFKQKLKEADKRSSVTGIENKIINLQELVGARKIPVDASKSSSRDWLDPHCHESQFEKKRLN